MDSIDDDEGIGRRLIETGSAVAGRLYETGFDNTLCTELQLCHPIDIRELTDVIVVPVLRHICGGIFSGAIKRVLHVADVVFARCPIRIGHKG